MSMAKGSARRVNESPKELQTIVRKLARIAGQYLPGDSTYSPSTVNGFDIKLQGFSKAKLSLAVYKEPISREYALEQATYMMFLGEPICPRIYAINETGYAMEYLRPYYPHVQTFCDTETLLEMNVWNRRLEDSPFAKQIGDESWREEQHSAIGIDVPDWALDLPCLIHGDPTLDNTLLTQEGAIKLTDPIPPHRLNKPSIKAVDQGKILQSIFGWETVLRGTQRQEEYVMPNFMQDYRTARRALFWAMVAVKRIGYHDWAKNATEWSKHLGGELECVLLS
jgi:hypothetical protein